VLTGFFSAVLVTGERLYSGLDAAGFPARRPFFSYRQST
jgi:hypothetical protein